MATPHVFWTDVDYMKLADWIGSHPQGVTHTEIEKHFQGCRIHSRITYMRDRGIIKGVPIPGKSTKVAAGDSYVRYVQVKRILPIDPAHPKQRGKGPTRLRVVDLHNGIPSLIPHRETLYSQKTQERPPVELTPRAMELSRGDPETVTIVYRGDRKALFVDGHGLHLALQNVNLKLELT